MIQLAIKDKTRMNAPRVKVPGETIEEKVRRMIENGEPVGTQVPLLYTERKDGVLPEFNIRTDKFDLAIDKMDIANKAQVSKRMDRIAKSEEAENPTSAPEETT